MIVVETGRLVLRRLSAADAGDLAPIFADPEVMRHYPATRDRAETGRWIATQEARARATGHEIWASCERTSGRLVGWAGLIAWTRDGWRETEVAYGLARDCWGRGFAAEAARACRDFGFDALGARRVVSFVDPANGPSRRVAERNGMRVVREIPWFGRTALVYAISRDEPCEPAGVASWIRPERGGDAPAIDAVVRAAFGRGAEADLVGRLRAEPGPLLSLVAVKGGRIAGHVALSQVRLEGDTDPRSPRLLGLAPVSVDPPFQRAGLGARLVREALARAPALGAAAVVVLGDPAYYGRFGFRPAARLGLGYADAPFAEAFQALELAGGALAGRRGLVRYAAAFDPL